MSRRRFYAPRSASLLNDKAVTLSLEESRHLRDVLRLQRGDEVYVFDGRGREDRCVIASVDRDGVTLDRVEEVQPARPESPLKLILGVALLKGEKFDLIVQKAAELGVARVAPILTTRADVRLRDEEEAKRKTERWRRIVLESTKQCGRARLMGIDAPIAFESLISRPGPDGELRLMFAERDGTSLAGLVPNLQPRPVEVFALVGSEGGWTDDEIAQARAQSWAIVTFGGRTLRAETAAIVVAALLQHAFGDLV